MAVDRVDTSAEKPPARRIPEDRPDAAVSRADSRAGAAAANTRDGASGPRADPFDRSFDRELPSRFDPLRAGLPEVSAEEAVAYVEDNAAERPWLESAKGHDPLVQRVFAALDQGRGHALERHEGHANDDRLQRRVTALEDPAQLDAEKRAAAIDGCRPGGRRHRCGATATAIQDPVAFAVAFARGVEHPAVEAALRTGLARLRSRFP